MTILTIDLPDSLAEEASDAGLLAPSIIEALLRETLRRREDSVDFPKQRAQANQPTQRKPLDFPVISVGKWPENLSLRREDMYGDDGR